jgi:transcriptional regulator with XRE-family HTH domain
MRSHHLPNYLRACRKRAGLSQAEIAFLLGCRRAEHISRYEHFSRTPSLRTALAFCVIFQIPLNELFRGEYHKVEKAVCRRARRLAARLAKKNPDQLTFRKLAFLKKIISEANERP